jgi:truncated hemoglobin YjbI
MIENLYELIGGRQTIEAATERFYEKVLQDEDLRTFFEQADIAHLGRDRLCSFPCFWVDESIPAKTFMARMPRREGSV